MGESMDFSSLTVKSIADILYVYSKAGANEKLCHQKYYGISFCESEKITYLQNGKKYVSTRDNAVLLPKGRSYAIIRQETGYFPVINFECDGLNTDEILLFDINDPSLLINTSKSLKTM